MGSAQIAFLILAHGDLEHLEHLVHALPQGSPKLVHLDAKVPNVPMHRAWPQTSFIAPRLETYWGGFSLVDATCRLLRTGLSLPDVQRLVLLSGSCFPIKPPGDITDFFDRSHGRQFIKCIRILGSNDHYEGKLRRYWISQETFAQLGIPGHLLRKILSRATTRLAKPLRRDHTSLSARYDVAFGSQWWSLTRPCAEHVVRIHDADRELNRFFSFTFAPDEMYFHTIVANSPFQTSERRFEPFQGRGTWRMANHHIIDPSLARWFTVADFDEITASQMLFVRKVRSLDGRELRRKLTDEILTKSPNARRSQASRTLARHSP
jgi:hypothetical protein